MEDERNPEAYGAAAAKDQRRPDQTCLQAHCLIALTASIPARPNTKYNISHALTGSAQRQQHAPTRSTFIGRGEPKDHPELAYGKFPAASLESFEVKFQIGD